MNKNPWERLKSEPPYWYERFSVYLELGKDRTLEEAARKWKVSHGGAHKFRGVSAAWIRASERYQWDERARAHDDMIQAKEDAEFEAIKKSIKSDLLLALRKCVNELKIFMNEVPLPVNMTFSQFLSSTEKLIDIYQKYFDETPTQRTEEKNLGRSLLINMGDFALPPEPEKTNGEEGRIGGTD